MICAVPVNIAPCFSQFSVYLRVFHCKDSNFSNIFNIYSILTEVGMPLKRRVVERVSVRMRCSVEEESERTATKVSLNALMQSGFMREYLP